MNENDSELVKNLHKLIARTQRTILAWAKVILSKEKVANPQLKKRCLLAQSPDYSTSARTATGHTNAGDIKEYGVSHSYISTLNS